jgi:glycine cleavage system H lipoate-binding protein
MGDTMKFISDDSAARHHLTPKKNRCVWMEAGILSYLLCDREFDCDRCPLDEAMRSHFSSAGKKTEQFQGVPPAAPVPPASSRVRAGTRVNAGADAVPAGAGSHSYFTADHLEVTLLDGGTARLGIEPGLARLLPPVKSAVLPHAGQVITPDSFSCWLVLEGGTLPMKLPVGGTVTAVNPILADEPHRVNGGIAADGWLFEFTPDDRAAFRRAFLKPGEAETRYVADLDTFRRLAIECLHPEGARAGLTLPDGGRFVDDLSTMIGPVKYLEIVRRVFRGNR